MSAYDRNAKNGFHHHAARARRAGPVLGRVRAAMEGPCRAAAGFQATPLDLCGHAGKARHGDGAFSLSERGGRDRRPAPAAPCFI